MKERKPEKKLLKKKPGLYEPAAIVQVYYDES